MNFWQAIVSENSGRDYAIAIAVAAAILLLILVVQRLASLRLSQHVAETRTRIDDLALDVVSATRVWAAALIALCAGALALSLPPGVTRVIRGVAVAVLALQIGLWSSRAVTFLVIEHGRRKSQTGDTSTLGAVTLLGAVGRLILWVVLGMLILDNIGLDVTPLVAGLGIGGLALALAVQNLLADLFASVSIVLDRPFDIGDTIAVADMEGTVEAIGIRTTRLRTVSGEQIIFGNNDLIKARIRNFKHPGDRRVAIALVLDRETPVDRAEAVPGVLQSIIEAQAGVRFERATITGLGKTGIEVEAVYHVTRPAELMAIKQRVSLAILRALQERDIHFV